MSTLFFAKLAQIRSEIEAARKTDDKPRLRKLFDELYFLIDNKPSIDAQAAEEE